MPKIYFSLALVVGVCYQIVNAKLQVVIDNVDYKSDENIAVLNISITDKRIVNYECDLKRDLDTMDLIIKYHFLRGEQPYFPLINTTINYCRNMQFLNENIFWRMIASNLFTENSNIPKTCPIPMKKYYLRNYSFADNLLPPYMPRMQYVLYLGYVLKNEFGIDVKFAEITFSGEIQDV